MIIKTQYEEEFLCTALCTVHHVYGQTSLLTGASAKILTAINQIWPNK